MDLEKYKVEEMTKSVQLFKKYKDSEKISINDFYMLDLKSPYGCPISGDYYQYWYFLPLYKSFIVRIYPMQDEMSFQKIYGLKVEDLIELRNKGRVKLLLERSPEFYKNLDYLYPLLEMRPPVVQYRYMAFLTAFCRNWLNYLDEGKQFLSGIHNPIFNLQIDGLEDQDFSNYATGYAYLKAFGYHDITNLIRNVAEIDRSTATSLIELYNVFLLRPIDSALDGLALTDETNYHSYLENIRVYSAITRDISPVNIDVGRSLIDMCGIHLPKQTKDLLKIDANEFQKAYSSLYETINRKTSYSELNDKKLALLEAIKETNESVDSLIGDQERIRDFIIYASTSVGLIGPTAAILSGNSLLAALAGLSSLSNIATPISNLITNLKYPNHVLFISRIRNST